MQNQLDILYQELTALKGRFILFLDKLKVRAQELTDETRANAQLIKNEDEQAYYNFKNGIIGQFNALERKAADVFDQQIAPFHYRELREALGLSTTASLEQISDLYTEIRDYFQDWQTELSNLEAYAFADVKNKMTAKERLQEIYTEFDQLKSKFTCTQCGSPIALERVYFMSTYVQCPACSSQNTFTPSSKMMQLPDVVREIAEERAAVYSHVDRSADALTQFKQEDRYYRTILQVSNALLPILEKEQQDIYARNLVDQYEHDVYDEQAAKDYFTQVMNYFKNELKDSQIKMQESLLNASESADFTAAYQSWRDDQLGIVRVLEKIKKKTNGLEDAWCSALIHQHAETLLQLKDWKTLWQQEHKDAVLALFSKV